MAASWSWSWRRRGVSDVGKQAVAQIWKSSANSSSSASAPSSMILAATNSSYSFVTNPRRYTRTIDDSSISVDDTAYEKNPDDGQGPSPVVPDELIQPESEDYWTPHPQTGVFVPPSLLEEEEELAAEEEEGDVEEEEEADTVEDNNIVEEEGESSVLDQTAFFRPTSIEDLEKPIDLVPDPSSDHNNEAAEQE